MTIATKTSSSSSAEAVPALHALDMLQCEEVLRSNIVGRLACALHDRVEIFPIHFVYESGSIYGRTDPGGKLVDILRNRRVAFEVDEHEDMFSWRSVIAHGSLYLVDSGDDDEAKTLYEHAVRVLRRLLPATFSPDDPVPFRTKLFRIQISELTGRAATPGGTPIQPSGPDTEDTESDPAADLALSAGVRRVIADLVPEGSKVNVDAFDRVVVLSGLVDTPSERSAIEKAVLALDNVKAVVEQLETAFPAQRREAPAEIARDALRELRGNHELESAEVKIVVDHEWLRAEGTAADITSKDEVLRRLRRVSGVRGVIDRIELPEVPVDNNS